MEGKGGLGILSQESADAQASPSELFQRRFLPFPFLSCTILRWAHEQEPPRRLFIAPIPTKIL